MKAALLHPFHPPVDPREVGQPRLPTFHFIASFIGHMQLRILSAIPVLFCIGIVTSVIPARASIIFSGSGMNPETSAIASGSASFTIVGDVLTLVLTNTTAPRTTAQGNALTGVSFDVDGGAPVLTLTSMSLSAGSTIWTSKTASNTTGALTGSWTSKLGDKPLGEYGVATTGFGGRFKGGAITRGNSSPDYGIVAAGTFNGSNVSFGGSKYPFIQNSLTFTFKGLSGYNESKISNVKLLFGTDGKGIVNAAPELTDTPAVPEPISLLMWASLGLAGTAVGYWRRRVDQPPPCRRN